VPAAFCLLAIPGALSIRNTDAGRTIVRRGRRGAPAEEAPAEHVVSRAD
jgi:hypothetical protein